MVLGPLARKAAAVLSPQWPIYSFWWTEFDQSPPPGVSYWQDQINNGLVPSMIDYWVLHYEVFRDNYPNPLLSNLKPGAKLAMYHPFGGNWQWSGDPLGYDTEEYANNNYDAAKLAFMQSLITQFGLAGFHQDGASTDAGHMNWYPQQKTMLDSVFGSGPGPFSARNYVMDFETNIQSFQNGMPGVAYDTNIDNIVAANLAAIQADTTWEPISAYWQSNLFVHAGFTDNTGMTLPMLIAEYQDARAKNYVVDLSMLGGTQDQIQFWFSAYMMFSNGFDRFSLAKPWMGYPMITHTWGSASGVATRVQNPNLSWTYTRAFQHGTISLTNTTGQYSYTFF